MEIKKILEHVDHTLLAQNATWAEIQQICDDAIAYHTASVCIQAMSDKQRSTYKTKSLSAPLSAFLTAI